MDATCTIQDNIHVFSLVHKYVSSILGTYQSKDRFSFRYILLIKEVEKRHNYGIIKP